ncbi:MAG TPA: hypothetical protein VNA24_37525 [Hyalangium sp.]|nr:hypothetical protein [Hyalangium sp.]
MGSKSTSKEFPGFGRIFSLGESGSRKAFRGDLGVETRDEVFALTRAELHPAHPITVEWAMGSAKPGDVIWTTYAVPVIISESVVQLLRSHGFTGWSLYDVSVRDKQGQPILGYSGLAITGRCGKIDYARTVVVPRVYPAGIFPIGKGLLFDPESWDGSDLFTPVGKGGFIFMVDEVKKVLERAKIRNVVFTPLEQYEVEMITLESAGVFHPPR